MGGGAVRALSFGSRKSGELDSGATGAEQACAAPWRQATHLGSRPRGGRHVSAPGHEQRARSGAPKRHADGSSVSTPRRRPATSRHAPPEPRMNAGQIATLAVYTDALRAGTPDRVIRRLAADAAFTSPFSSWTAGADVRAAYQARALAVTDVTVTSSAAGDDV